MNVLRWLAVPILCFAMDGAALAQQAAPPGQFDYYLLTLSWSPAYCATHRGPAAHDECAQQRGFIVHGLWPQNENGTWPAFCRAVQPVAKERIAHELPIMPNGAMIEHEWDKHGSCTTQTAAAYFDTLDRAFAAFHVPEALDRPKHAVSLPLAAAKRLIADANPGLDPAMFALRCAAGTQVEELRICLDTGFRPRLCGKDVTDTCRVTARFGPTIDSTR
ncbi:MAG TPA: ribonuclease T [Magnetospirillaceae bacterium]|jgi:ribonuclease T2